MTELRILDLSHTPVTDLIPLGSLPKLERLVLQGTGVSPDQVQSLKARLPDLVIV